MAIYLFHPFSAKNIYFPKKSSPPPQYSNGGLSYTDPWLGLHDKEARRQLYETNSAKGGGVAINHDNGLCDGTLYTEIDLRRTVVGGGGAASITWVLNTAL